MARLGYKCDQCGYENDRHGPAAVEKVDGEWVEMCSDCYDEWWEENMED